MWIVIWLCRKSANAASESPSVISGRGPILSASRPAIGAVMMITAVEGRKRTPASSGVYPRMFCMYSARKKNIESIANVTMKATEFAPRNERERKYSNWTIGARPRSSKTTNAANATTAVTSSATIAGDPQCQRLPSTRALCGHAAQWIDA